MENGSVHFGPSVLSEIQGDLFISKFRNFWTPAPGIIGLLQSPLKSNPSSQVDVLKEEPLKERSSGNRLGLPPYVKGATFGASMTLMYPLERVKFLMQSQNELIKSGRLSRPYKGIGDCFARTIRNEGFFHMWRGNAVALFRHLSCLVIRGRISSSESYRGLCNYYDKDKDGILKAIAWTAAMLCLSDCAMLFALYPLDYAKTRLANDIRTSGGERQFSGLVDVYRKTLKSDGIVGFYRGFNIAWLASSTRLFLNFQVTKILYPVAAKRRDNMKCRAIIASGIFVASDFVAYPMDTVSRRMIMCSGESIKYKSSSHAFSQILRNEGLQSLYKGFGAQCLKNAFVVGLATAATTKLRRIHLVFRYGRESGEENTRT